MNYVAGECPRCGQPMGEVPDPMPEGWVCFPCEEKDKAAQRIQPSSDRPEHLRPPVMYDTDDTPQLRFIRAEEAMRKRERADVDFKFRIVRFKRQTLRERGLHPGRYDSRFHSKPRARGTIPTHDRRRLIDEFKRTKG